ncbi:mycofactocin precursor MftA [Naumannella halotolerans]|uniref:Mycofactocin n=1 Tax=Naumannella halotolerans TaxID=993414 RepID=A0A4R7J9Z5_9ACTN|nr:mycofactocin precursor MftA [Naumannella halotolerans]TDT33343.1 mycofactocin precursor [Naumannella halotolerans]
MPVTPNAAAAEELQTTSAGQDRSGDVPEQPQAPDPVVAEESLVEEVSIDGMCGVY